MARASRPRALPAFQFFPSWSSPYARKVTGSRLERLSILSQLQQKDVIAEALELYFNSAFQFFPSCSGGSSGWTTATSTRSSFNSFPVAAADVLHVDHGEVRVPFQFFPSCSSGGRGGVGVTSSFFQFFPSCSRVCPRCGSVYRSIAFNSFPVAAETLPAYSLISLSSANFEVRENSLALPSYTCSGSREAFPDSRRKEGRWRERSGVEQKR